MHFILFAMSFYFVYLAGMETNSAKVLDIFIDNINTRQVENSRNKVIEKFRIAIDQHDFGTIKKLTTKYEKAIPTIVTKEQDSLLHLAATGGNVDIVRLFHEIGIAVNAENNNRFTPLHFAASPQVIDYLVLNGASLYKKGIRGILPVHTCLCESALKHMIDQYKIDPLIKDSEGWTILHHAANKSNASLISFIIREYELSVHEKNYNGEIPLLCAPNLDTITVMIQAGSNLNCLRTKNSGKTVWQRKYEDKKLDKSIQVFLKEWAAKDSILEKADDDKMVGHCAVCYEDILPAKFTVASYNCLHFICIDCKEGMCSEAIASSRTAECPVCREKMFHDSEMIVQ